MHCQIFVKVIDNFGDVGVVFRLAQQLSKHGYIVTLFCDQLDLLQKLAGDSEYSVSFAAFPLSLQQYLAYDKRCAASFLKKLVVIEAFSVNLPDWLANYLAKEKPFLWLNLEYLALEEWADSCHLLPSPHPQLAVNKYFYFPGFSAKCGGLLRDHQIVNFHLNQASSLEQSWQNIVNIFPQLKQQLKPEQQQNAHTYRKISFMAYDLALSSNDNLQQQLTEARQLSKNFAQLLNFWADGKEPSYLFVAADQSLNFIHQALTHLLGCQQNLSINQLFNLNNLYIYPYSFICQKKFDLLLMNCQVNFVRGEDSFVQAHWCQGLYIWQCYPQQQSARADKLNAYLAAAQTSEQLRNFYLAWNCCTAEFDLLSLWQELELNWQENLLQQANWRNHLQKQEDLAQQLTQFIKKML